MLWNLCKNKNKQKNIPENSTRPWFTFGSIKKGILSFLQSRDVRPQEVYEPSFHQQIYILCGYVWHAKGCCGTLSLNGARAITFPHRIDSLQLRLRYQLQYWARGRINQAFTGMATWLKRSNKPPPMLKSTYLLSKHPLTPACMSIQAVE